MNTVLYRTKHYCPLCKQNGKTIIARWKLPQSSDKGNMVTFVDVCNSHHDTWWDNADWDGKSIERKIIYKNR